MKSSLKIAVILLSIGTPLAFIPMALLYLFGFSRQDKLAVFVLFLTFSILFGNVDYLAFMLLFVFAIIVVTRPLEFIFLTLSLFLLMFQPVNVLTYQLILFVIGAVLLSAMLLPEVIPYFLNRHREVPRSEAERKLYERLRWN
ncbi:MAG: hypothetical protein ACP5M9_04360 [Candidatus Micrarchaeia archaeon]